MTLSRRVIGCLSLLLILASLPGFAIRRGDTGSSGDGLFSNCPPNPNNGVCAFVQAEGTTTLSGTDQSGNAVTVTITLYDWGYYKCSRKSCQKQPIINYSVLDVALTGTDSAGVESLVVKGVLQNPEYVSCGGQFGTVGLGCIYSPEPDSDSNVQEPTPIGGSDGAGDTRWDFGGVPPLDPPLPAIPFDQLQCYEDGHDQICAGSPLGEAVLVAKNSVKQNHLGTASSDYLVTLTDGTQLGTLAVPAPPAKQVVNTNNTQAAETVITKPHFNDYTDSSQAYPQINADGSMNYPEGFALAPVPPPSSPSFPSCYPTNEATGQPDTRTFRTAWYSFTAPSNGTITISTVRSSYDTLLYVFTGSASQPTSVSCNDDSAGGHALQAVTSFKATKGTNYQILVYETPPFQTNAPGTLTGYPLSIDGALDFGFQFKTSP